MNTDVRKILLFLGAKSAPAKASPSTTSKETLNFSYWTFPDNILPKTPSFSQFPFETDWNWLMIAVQQFNKIAATENKSGNYQVRDWLNTVVTLTYNKQLIYNRLIECIDKLNKIKCK